MGAYHTIDLEMNRKFTLQKTEWDAIALERVEMATNPARTADVAAVVMAEGLAQVCLITASMTIVRQRVESTIPRKRKGSASLHDKVALMPRCTSSVFQACTFLTSPQPHDHQALNKFYENVMQGILRHVDFDIIKCVIIASPGFVREQFFEYMNGALVPLLSAVLGAMLMCLPMQPRPSDVTSRCSSNTRVSLCSSTLPPATSTRSKK